MPELLAVHDIDVSYGPVQVIWGCSLTVNEGEIVALFGGNGAGKTTTLRAISRLIGLKAGRIEFDGCDVSNLPAHALPELGLAHVPEGRRMFPLMTVEENLELGAYPRRVRGRVKDQLAKVYDLFPLLKERRRNPAQVLSGGQQQMVAIGRGLMADPKLLILDEPSLGLAPAVVSTLFETINKIRGLGVTVLLVEQNLWETMEIADRFYLIETGKVVSSGVPSQLRENQRFREAYLGI